VSTEATVQIRFGRYTAGKWLHPKLASGASTDRSCDSAFGTAVGFTDRSSRRQKP
jgi:hypothetical protein